MSFGLGQKFTDTDLSEQSSGSIPSTKLFDKFYGKTGWKAITIRSLSIGQGEILVTPLQLANQAATIANDGYYISPHLNKNDSMRIHRHNLAIKKEHFEVVKAGMHRVMVYGTGRHYAVDSLHMAGKTGTVQNPRIWCYLGLPDRYHDDRAIPDRRSQTQRFTKSYRKYCTQ